MIALHTSTGISTVDAALQGLVAIFEMLLPGRIRSYYVEGSYADQSAVTTSDLDIVIMFKDRFVDEAEQSQAEQLGVACAALSGRELDIAVIDEVATVQGISPMLKLGSNCIYGEDTRDRMQLLPIDEWARQRMHAAFWLINNIFKRPALVRQPLPYPDPAGSFYGYTERTVQLPNGSIVPSTRNLIRVSGWAATALLASQAGVYVPHKRECHVSYRQYIGDEWSELLTDLYEYCRTRWNYLLPEGAADQERLRELCRRMLAWENHFVGCYKHFVLRELRNLSTEAQFHAARVLAMVPFDDAEIQVALQELFRSDRDQVREVAMAAVANLEKSKSM